MLENAYYLKQKSKRQMSKFSAGFIVVLLYFRLFAGAVGNFIEVNLTALTTLIILISLIFLIIAQPIFLKRFKWLFVYIVIFIAVSAATLLVSKPPNPILALDFLIRLVFLLAWGIFFSSHFIDRKTIGLFHDFVRFSLVLGGGLAIVQVTLFPEIFSIRGETRAFGMMAHPVPFSMYMTTALVASESIRLKFARRRNLFDMLAIVSGLIGIYLAVAQTAAIMLLLTIGFLVVSRLSVRKKIFFAPAIGFLSVILLYASPWTREIFSMFTIFEHFNEISPDRYNYRLAENSMSWRVINWKMSVYQVLPVWYSGLGAGHAEYFNYFGLTLHSMPLEVFVEVGLFGLISLVLILSGIRKILMCETGARSIADLAASRLARAYAMSLLVASFFSVTFLDQTLTIAVFFSLVFIVAKPSKSIA